jgi:hypothetical protein
MKFVIGPDQVYFHFRDVFIFTFSKKLTFAEKELLPSGGFFVAFDLPA